MEENRSFDAAPDTEDIVGDENTFEDAHAVIRDTSEDETDLDADERSQYEFLVKKRFKELYAEDTQRLINRRFRKYKVMEERFKLLEESLAEKEALIGENQRKIDEFDALLRSEVEKAVKETEERVIREIRAKQIRPSENGSLPSVSQAPFDVSMLTKSERASLARRAAGGEKIKF